jgi:hypothetical protein
MYQVELISSLHQFIHSSMLTCNILEDPCSHNGELLGAPSSTPLVSHQNNRSIQKFNLAHGSICSCHRKNIFQNIKKLHNKNLRIRLDILCVHAKFCEKPTCFVSSVKRHKIYHAKLFLAPNFVLHNTKIIFFTGNDLTTIENI